MRKNVTEYLDITEGLYSEKIAVEDANGCITFGEMKRNALKIATPVRDKILFIKSW